MEQLELEALKENAADLQAIDCEPTDKRNPLARSDRARSIAFSSGSFREHANAVIKQDRIKQDSIKKKKKVKECAVHCLIDKPYLCGLKVLFVSWLSTVIFTVFSYADDQLKS